MPFAINDHVYITSDRDTGGVLGVLTDDSYAIHRDNRQPSGCQRHESDLEALPVTNKLVKTKYYDLIVDAFVDASGIRKKTIVAMYQGGIGSNRGQKIK